jgi:hypothetical protein
MPSGILTNMETFTSQIDDLLDQICESLQLTSTQYKAAKGHYEAVAGWLGADGSALVSLRPAIYAQGSLAIGTTVRPMKHTEYDLDLVCQLMKDWTTADAVAALNLIEWRLRENEIYKPMVERKKRCIRLNYANEFHLDVLPGLPDWAAGGTCLRVPDRELKAWKASNPLGYAAWFEARAALRRVMAEKFAMAPLPAQESSSEKPPLKRIVQLLKRWRDLAYVGRPDGRAPISIVLTTLAGLHYDGSESISEGLSAILEGIVAALPRDRRLVVLNPTNKQEDLSERWDKDPDSYREFVHGITDLRDRWREVIASRGVPKVTRFLEFLFGEYPLREVLKAQGDRIREFRVAGKLSVQPASGLLVPAAAGIARVKDHTFHGEIVP